MRRHPFKQVDVFTSVPMKGNPVAVVFDADALSAGEMQAIAGWTNLSETTFLCAPSSPAADYRLRIFTPQAELPFAGHPTLGSAHAFLEGSGSGKLKLVQECGAGLIDISVEANRYFLKLPPSRMSPVAADSLAALEQGLGARVSGARPVVIDLGPKWLVAELPSAAACRALSPDYSKLAELSLQLDITGVTVFGRTPAGSEAALEVRAFAPAHGIPEDPVCGSGNGAVALFLKANGEAGSGYAAGQGYALGRDGKIAIRYAENAIWLGGCAVTCIDGMLSA